MPLDEVKPGNKITAELKKMILDAPAKASTDGSSMLLMKKLKLSVVGS